MDENQERPESNPPGTPVQPAQTETARAAGPDEAAKTGGAGELREQIIEQLKTVFDPEIPVNIYEMGLIYEVRVEDDGATFLKMTLTSPSCPAAEELPPEVESKARGVEGVTKVELDLVWDPPWHPDMMSEAAKLELGMM